MDGCSLNSSGPRSELNRGYMICDSISFYLFNLSLNVGDNYSVSFIINSSPAQTIEVPTAM
jgi:hypothetical protein